jgi:hypothetical protein
MREQTVVDITTALARIRVIHGGSPDEVVFQRGQPSRLLVGSDAGAALCFERADVAPRQFDVIWDGGQLWLQDALRLGRTFVDGRTLNEWLPIVGNAVVRFGGVRLWMFARTARPRIATPDFAALDRARLTEAHHNARARLSETGRITLPPDFVRCINGPDAP